MAEYRGGGRMESILRGGGSSKRNSRERKEITDPDLSDKAIESPDDQDSDTYGPRNPSIKSKPHPRYTKEQVRYEHPAKGKDDCDDCAHFICDSNACELVKGNIEPEDWCRKFEKGSGDHEEEGDRDEEV